MGDIQFFVCRSQIIPEPPFPSQGIAGSGNEIDDRVVSKTCLNVSLPNHPHLEKQTLFGELLMKKIRKKSGNIFWYPKNIHDGET